MERGLRKRWSRREFLNGLTVAGTAGLLGVRLESLAAEPPPETTRLRIVRAAGICQAPKYVAEEFLRGEGFTEVQYVKKEGSLGNPQGLISGEADITMHFAGPLIIHVDVGDPIILLGGGHVGCFELFGTDRVRAVRDLKGKTVAVRDLGGSEHVYLSSMLAYVGLDPRKDVNWAPLAPDEAKRLLI